MPEPKPLQHYARVAEQYCLEILLGQPASCKWTRLACQRHLDDLQRQQDPDWPYEFSTWHAWDVCDFLEQLPHVEGEWDTPTLVLQPWQIFIFSSVFGWRKRANPKWRRFNTAYVEVARKQGKSAISSGIGLYCLTREEEIGAQVKIAATTGSQARIVFDVAHAMVEKTPDLREQHHVQAMANAIVCWQNNGSIKPINSKASTQDGLNPHLSIVDELHAHKTRALFDVLKSARGARKNPLSWYITTAGDNVAGVCYEQRDFLTKVLQRILEADHYFGIIYSLDVPTAPGEPGDDPYDESVWIKANPNLGVSVQLEEMRTYAGEARALPQTAAEFKTKRLNLWLNAADSLIPVEHWDQCADSSLTLEYLSEYPCWLGVDLATVDDIADLSMVFATPSGFAVLNKHYLPREVVEEKCKENAHYLAWNKQKLFTLTEGFTTDYSHIETEIKSLIEKLNVQEVIFDPFQATYIYTNLTNEYPEGRIIMGGNSVKWLSHPTKELLARIKAHVGFRHSGDPVLRWMASNVVGRFDEKGNVLPKKVKNSSRKVDGIIAMLMAMNRAMLGGDNASVYASRGIITI